MAVIKYRQIRDAAQQCAEWILQSPPDRDTLISKEVLRQAGNFPEARDLASKKEHDSYNMAYMQYIEYVRFLVHKVLGRWLQTVRGKGFRLLAPSEIAAEAEEVTYRKMMDVLQKGKFILDHIKDEDLSVEERQEKTDAQVRIAAMTQMVRSTKQSVLSKPSPSGGSSSVPFTPTAGSVKPTS